MLSGFYTSMLFHFFKISRNLSFSLSLNVVCHVLVTDLLTGGIIELSITFMSCAHLVTKTLKSPVDELAITTKDSLYSTYMRSLSSI